MTSSEVGECWPSRRATTPTPPLLPREHKASQAQPGGGAESSCISNTQTDFTEIFLNFESRAAFQRFVKELMLHNPGFSFKGDNTADKGRITARVQSVIKGF